MTARRPLPTIAPCPSSIGGHHAARLQSVGAALRVLCSCGWTGPVRRTESRAILAWNRRSDAGAERRGAMAAVEWLQSKGLTSEAVVMSMAIDRGEVLPAKGARKR